MRRAVLWTVLRPRGRLGCGLAAVAVILTMWRLGRVERAFVAEAPRQSVATAAPAKSAAPISSPHDASAVPVHVVVKDLRGRPVAGAEVEVWADGRGCVDRSWGNDLEMRGDIVDAPAGQVVWRSASGTTTSDGTLELHVPIGMMTHVVAFHRDGRRAVFRAPDDDCFAPCAGFGGCGTCSHAPCTWPRHDGRCASEIVDVALRLAKPAHVVGRVADAGGRPIAGARVGMMAGAFTDELSARGSLMGLSHAEPLDEWSRSGPRPPHQHPVLTGADGWFAFDAVQSSFVVGAAAPGYRLGTSRRMRMRAGRSMHVAVRLHRARHLDLSVVDVGGRPVSGARVALDDVVQDATTDAEGRINLDGLDARAHDLAIHGDGFALFLTRVTPRSRSVDVELTPVRHVMVDVSAPLELIARIGDRPLLELQLLRGDESLVAGRVRGPESAPDVRERNPFMTDVERADIETAAVKVALARAKDAIARRQSVVIGADGRGRTAIEEIPPGEYRVCVAAPGPGSCGPTVRVESKRSPAVTLHLRADASIASWD